MDPLIQIDDRFSTQWRVTSSFKFAPAILSTSIVLDPANAMQIDVGFCDINRTFTQDTITISIIWLKFRPFPMAMGIICYM